MATPMLMSEALSVSVFPVLCDSTLRGALSLSGHQKLNIRLPLSPSPKASQALLAKEGNGGSDEEGLIVLLTHS